MKKSVAGSICVVADKSAMYVIYGYKILKTTIKNSVHCHGCKHYYITWDKNFPNGCRIMNFKSKVLPCINVYKNSGMNCLKFEQKQVKVKK